MMKLARLLLFSLLLFSARGQTPQWIWHSDTNANTVFFRKTFRTPPLLWNARLTVSADDRAEVFLNGVSVAHCTDWRNPSRGEVSVRLNQGENVIAVKAENASGPAGLLVHLNLGGQTNIVSDATWLASTNEERNWSALAFVAASWTPARSMGEHGMQPWGDVLFRASATPAEALKVADGFRVELLRSAEPDEGSWICMTFDDRGRLIISPQGDQRPFLRMTIENGKVAKVEPLAPAMHYAMGLLHAFDSLYVNGHGPNGTGLYRLIDENKNDQYETNEIHFLKKFEGESEHGYHGLALGPDKHIYVINGNGTKLPEGISTNSPYRHYAEDALSGSIDNSDDQDGSKVPNCHVLQTDAEGREWKLWCGGMRNAYALDFNEDGELFTFDSDMEWDWGTPWYRPTRILHLVSAGEYGWRDGTRMWADWFPDSLPAVCNIGIGSPTGVKFGRGSNFPEKYRRALFVQDWSYGRILAVHLSPHGGTYTGKWETFLQGTPLNLTSLAFGPDGAMYFIAGGRATQSGVYRVSYHGPAEQFPKATLGPQPRDYREDRKTRKEIEALHGEKKIDGLPTILDRLVRLDDPSILYAARVALELYAPESWEEYAISSKRGDLASFSVALARSGSIEANLRLLKRLTDFPFTFLPKLRVMELMLLRSGNDPRIGAAIRPALKSYPTRNTQHNRELSRLALRLNAPRAVSATVKLLESAPTQEEQMHYIEQLRNVREGWTIEDRRIFFEWFLKPRDPKAHPPELLQYFKDVGRSYVDGAYFDRYLRDFRRQAIATLTAEERKELGPLLERPIVQAQSIPANNRSFVKDWKLEDLVPELNKSRKPNLARGRQAFVDAQCLTCHRYGNDGGIVGPELTGAGSKYSARDILESIIEPSKIINEQYQNHTAILKDGDSFSGRLVQQSEAEVILETDRLTGNTEKIPRANISEVRPSQLSPMPSGLVNTLSKDEIFDLVAYLRGGTEAK